MYQISCHLIYTYHKIHKMYQISCHFNLLTEEHCLRMMFFKLILIFVIMTIQNSNSMEIPSDCKDIECIAKLFREQKETIPRDPEENSENSGKI